MGLDPSLDLLSGLFMSSTVAWSVKPHPFSSVLLSLSFWSLFLKGDLDLLREFLLLLNLLGLEPLLLLEEKFLLLFCLPFLFLCLLCLLLPLLLSIEEDLLLLYLLGPLRFLDLLLIGLLESLNLLLTGLLEPLDGDLLEYLLGLLLEFLAGDLIGDLLIDLTGDLLPLDDLDLDLDLESLLVSFLEFGPSIFESTLFLAESRGLSLESADPLLLE